MKRVLFFLYGVICYAAFFVTLLYAIGFIGNFGVPKTLDSGPIGPLGEAIAINLGLLALFALQHSVMARKGFKRVWTKIVPTPIERSTYVLFTSLALIVMFLEWRPMGGTIWDVSGTLMGNIMYALYGFGLVLVLIATFLINHFDLFGLRQVYLYLRGKEYTGLKFGTPGPYKMVRHPLYVGWFFTFWATPTMTAAHLLFAVMTTLYILIAIQFEERDLVSVHGDDYINYRKRVPMLIPKFNRKRKATETLARA